MILAYGIGLIIIITFCLIFMAVAIELINKDRKSLKVINIDEWKKMNIINIELKKRIAILERKVIKLILEEEEEELETETEYDYSA